MGVYYTVAPLLYTNLKKVVKLITQILNKVHIWQSWEHHIANIFWKRYFGIRQPSPVVWIISPGIWVLKWKRQTIVNCRNLYNCSGFLQIFTQLVKIVHSCITCNPVHLMYTLSIRIYLVRYVNATVFRNILVSCAAVYFTWRFRFSVFCFAGTFGTFVFNEPIVISPVCISDNVIQYH